LPLVAADITGTAAGIVVDTTAVDTTAVVAMAVIGKRITAF
jgi:hypothetical protein